MLDWAKVNRTEWVGHLNFGFQAMCMELWVPCFPNEKTLEMFDD